MKNKKLIGIVIFAILIILIVVLKFANDSTQEPESVDEVKGLTTVYVATGGGKEDFLADEEVQKILKNKYKLNVIFDTWSNGKTITVPLIRETVGLGNQEIVKRISNGENFTIKSANPLKLHSIDSFPELFEKEMNEKLQ